MSSAARPPSSLPCAERARWQPLRLGLVDLYRYDSEEFLFRDGHLLLRGNNGTGKSKVLSLTLPFLFDANLSSARVEPDGDRGKRMEWNLLLNGAFERRIGYTWIEFGRLDEHGQPHYFTLGAGLRAVAGRSSVDAWFFTSELRVGDSLWLTSAERTALSRERLIEALGSRGRVYATASDYRHAVDAQLFGLGKQRYGALIDTLIQLRQPQLSKQPDEKRLSNALSDALAPLDPVALEDVAVAMSQLEDYRRELEELGRIHAAVGVFGNRYRRYAQIASRRRARVLRQAQTETDSASRAFNDAEAERDATRDRVKQLSAEQSESEQVLQAARTRLDVLKEDPVMRDAGRLQHAAAEAESAARLLLQAQQRRQSAQRRLADEQHLRDRRQQAVEHSRSRAADAEGVAGSAAMAAGTGRHADLLDGLNLPDGIAGTPEARWQRLTRDGQAIVDSRREQIRLIRQRLRECQQATHARDQAREQARLHNDAFEAAQAAVTDALVSQRERIAGSIADWQCHLAGLTELSAAPLLDLLDGFESWAEAAESTNPLRRSLLQQWSALQHGLARREAQLTLDRAVLAAEQAELLDERAALESGNDLPPPLPSWRSDSAHPGSRPLWQLVDFVDDIDPAAAAGLEAALQASGLLAGMIDSSGALRDPAIGELLLQPRPAQPASLARWLRPTPDADALAAGIDADTIAQLLDSIACGPEDVTGAECWLAPDGRFRLGPARGAWTKPAAEHVGFAARAAARRQRLAAIGVRLAEIEQTVADLDTAIAAIGQSRSQAQRELDSAPSDEPLQRAALAVVEAERSRRTQQERLGEARSRLATLERTLSRAIDTLHRDAADVGLPHEALALEQVDTALQDYRLALQAMLDALRQHATTLSELAAQQLRVDALAGDVEAAEVEYIERRDVSISAATAHATLKDSVGLRVEALQQRIDEAGKAVSAEVRNLARIGTALKTAIGDAGAAAQKVDDRKHALQQRQDERQHAIERLQAFAATGLIEDAIEAVALPALAQPWGVETALVLARRIEQSLQQVASEDDDWSRIQKPLGGDLQVLQQALSAQGHQAYSELIEECMVVRIVHRQQPQRPDEVLRRVAAELAERQQLLSAREREVLENHLQKEIAVDLQSLIRDTDARVDAINVELARRPTSTGVRFKLVWEPLPDGDDDAPGGLVEARRRLLRTSADAWSPEDRRVVGVFLQSRIDSERQRDDRATLLESLTHALDYRSWHRFRVMRQQDGLWKPLSGPASSGERALGLTVPLFAAASSHYRSARADAPRLVLLDEAFAGIDDEARANCMGLIREFDLDFVMTSEREWACYAELPGVSICQLVRREGIDAVLVSRWCWNGRSRQAVEGPERRFPTAVEQ